MVMSAMNMPRPWRCRASSLRSKLAPIQLPACLRSLMMRPRVVVYYFALLYAGRPVVNESFGLRIFGGSISGRNEDSLERDDDSSNRHPALAFWWSMILSENRYPPRIKSGAGFFGIML